MLFASFQALRNFRKNERLTFLLAFQFEPVRRQNREKSHCMSSFAVALRASFLRMATERTLFVKSCGICLCRTDCYGKCEKSLS